MKAPTRNHVRSANHAIDMAARRGYHLGQRGRRAYLVNCRTLEETEHATRAAALNYANAHPAK